MRSLDPPPGAVCVEDDCWEPATHERPTGHIADDYDDGEGWLAVEFVCARHDRLTA